MSQHVAEARAKAAQADPDLVLRDIVANLQGLLDKLEDARQERYGQTWEKAGMEAYLALPYLVRRIREVGEPMTPPSSCQEEGHRWTTDRPSDPDEDGTRRYCVSCGLHLDDLPCAECKEEGYVCPGWRKCGCQDCHLDRVAAHEHEMAKQGGPA